MVIDQGNFHIVNNDLKFANNWELTHFPKSAAPRLNQYVDFIITRSFFTCSKY